MRRYFISAIVFGALILVAGCSKKSQPEEVSTTTTVSQALSMLQSQGKLPTLDTSSSLTGTDSDKNGVRDDLDTFIANLPDTRAQKRALTQLAQAIQVTLVINLASASSVSLASLNLHRAVSCIWSVYPTDKHAKTMLIQELTVNTMPRLVAYENYNAIRNGTTSQALSGSFCN